jgi:hypothetical protein
MKKPIVPCLLAGLVLTSLAGCRAGSPARGGPRSTSPPVSSAVGAEKPATPRNEPPAPPPGPSFE